MVLVVTCCIAKAWWRAPRRQIEGTTAMNEAAAATPTKELSERTCRARAPCCPKRRVLALALWFLPMRFNVESCRGL
jgi:hypothetical protein